MNIYLYFREIKQKINKINKYVSNPVNYKDVNNPFLSDRPQTYIWIEDNNDKFN